MQIIKSSNPHIIKSIDIFEALSKETQGFKLSEIQKIFPQASARKVISNLLDKGYINVQHELKDQYKEKKEKYVELNPSFRDEASLQILMTKMEKAPKQLALFLTYLHIEKRDGSVPQKQLLAESETTTTQLNALVKKEIFTINEVVADRIVFSDSDPVEEITLSELQETAYQKIKESFEKKRTVLLKGITGSGKTHIYFQLIEDALKQGKQVLYLLPEIALTAQIIRRLQAKFGDQIGIYHSRFGNQERVEIWQKTLQGKAKIILGARSSLLLPFKNLGLIIIDEEHDTSFKQHEPAPRYQARDAALVLAHQVSAHIILGSGTPSVESFHNVTDGKYDVVELNERYGSGSLPKVSIIDLKKVYEAKEMKGLFSFQLLAEMKTSLEERKQIILFQNRRGYSPFLLCQSCGWVPQCENCDVSLTYHKNTDKLHCHYCASVYPYVVICPTCNSNQVIAKSFGTEKIEEEIQKEFPKARVARFDWDALKSKNKYKELITKFEKRQIDILVGTQMVVKGLDFEHVNLVGVLSADSLLAFPDYRVNERVYQLLSQVSGRAGRKDDLGKVLIQTHRHDHPVIAFVQQHDYNGFFAVEHKHRLDFVYPPFCKLIRITLKHRDPSVCNHAAIALATKLSELTDVHLIGPAAPPVARIRNKYLQEILIKMPKHNMIIKRTKDEIYSYVNEMTALRNFSTVQVILDVDP